MFKRNKTAKWLKTKSSEEKEKLFKACIKMGRQQRQVHCQREEGIRVHRQQVLKEREQALIAKQRKEKQKKEELCQQVLREGYWNSEAKIRAGLHVVCGKSESRCRKYLEVQLRFRQHVLNRRTSTNHFSVYQKREKSCHLKNYLTILLTLISAVSLPTTEEILKCPKLLVGMQVKHCFEDEGIFTW